MNTGVYVHIPFCIRKCHYCSFNSIPYEKETAARYMDALSREIDSCRNLRGITSVYIGGGTPSIIPQHDLEALLKRLNGKFDIAEGTEATLEANPGALHGLDLKKIRDGGINRISLGVQSFDPDELIKLGRQHGIMEVGRSVKELREAGFKNLSLDLIYSIPGQDERKWKESLEKAASLGPEHISIYDLSIEVGTRFYSEVKAGRLALPPEPVQVDMYLHAIEFLEGAGFHRYEISNFARPGYECAHNLNYWSVGEYISFGAGAHSYIDGKRTRNIEDVGRYIDTVTSGGRAAECEEALSAQDMIREFVMLSLRKAEGLSLEEFRERFGRRFKELYGGKLDPLFRAGYLGENKGYIYLTVKGILASNRVITEFF
ncbi:MAG: radical SAM family heme chaperone HemW [Nitrospirota bacterium]